MWILVIIGMTLSVLLSFFALRDEGGAPSDLASAKIEMNSYRLFIQGANIAFEIMPVPVNVTRYYWHDLRDYLPSSMRDASVRNDWYVVREPDGIWYACTALPEKVLTSVASIYPAAEQGTLVKKVANQQRYVLSLSDQNVDEQAAQCDK